MDETEKKLRAELENMHLRGQSWMSESEGWEEEIKTNNKAGSDAEESTAATLEKLEKRKKDLVCLFLCGIFLVIHTNSLLYC